MTKPIEELVPEYHRIVETLKNRIAFDVDSYASELAGGAFDIGYNAGLDAAAEEVKDESLRCAGGWLPSRPYEKTQPIRDAILKRKL